MSKLIEYCTKCDKDQPVTEKMFHVHVCEVCNTITSEGDCGISKVGR